MASWFTFPGQFHWVFSLVQFLTLPTVMFLQPLYVTQCYAWINQYGRNKKWEKDESGRIGIIQRFQHNLCSSSGKGKFSVWKVTVLIFHVVFSRPIVELLASSSAFLKVVDNATNEKVVLNFNSQKRDVQNHTFLVIGEKLCPCLNRIVPYSLTCHISGAGIQSSATDIRLVFISFFNLIN